MKKTIRLKKQMFSVAGLICFMLTVGLSVQYNQYSGLAIFPALYVCGYFLLKIGEETEQ